MQCSQCNQEMEGVCVVCGKAFCLHCCDLWSLIESVCADCEPQWREREQRELAQWLEAWRKEKGL